MAVQHTAEAHTPLDENQSLDGAPVRLARALPLRELVAELDRGAGKV